MDWELYLLAVILGIPVGCMCWVVGYFLTSIHRHTAWLPIVVIFGSSLVIVAGSYKYFGSIGSVFIFFVILMTPVFFGCVVAWKFPQPRKWAFIDGVCDKCGYSLAGLDGGECPECGEIVVE